MKRCNSCNSVKDFSCFYRRANKYQHKCKNCEREYKSKNKERDKQSKRRHYEKNRAKIIERAKEHKRKYGAQSTRRMFALHPEKKMIHHFRCRIRDKIKQKKTTNTIKLIGCTVGELKTHLERQFKRGMRWSNYGKNGWHIDHIIPCARFNLKNDTELRQCFHYTNLQPLWATENMKKGGRLSAPTQMKIPI